LKKFIMQTRVALTLKYILDKHWQNQEMKTVEAIVQSVSSTTHSYTIMPIISASGRLLSPLYIVLKESMGTFGPRVQDTLFRPVNIYIQASKSGKL